MGGNPTVFNRCRSALFGNSTKELKVVVGVPVEQDGSLMFLQP